MASAYSIDRQSVYKTQHNPPTTRALALTFFRQWPLHFRPSLTTIRHLLVAAPPVVDLPWFINAYERFILKRQQSRNLRYVGGISIGWLVLSYPCSEWGQVQVKRRALFWHKNQCLGRIENVVKRLEVVEDGLRSGSTEARRGIKLEGGCGHPQKQSDPRESERKWCKRHGCAQDLGRTLLAQLPVELLHYE